MPELPEVETVVRGLRPILVGQTITQLKVFAPPRSIETSGAFPNSTIESLLCNRRVETITRRGKNILIQLDNELVLWVHLKMTGQFRHLPASSQRDPHDLFIMTLASTHTDGIELRFNDYRRFGHWRVLTLRELNEHPSFCTLGPEPLEISAEKFMALARCTKRQIKGALLDQSFLAGVGNIYADESLWAARIHPLRLTSTISIAKLAELHGHIQRLLTRSIKFMGTSVDSFRAVNGQVGSFQTYLKVYGREGEKCSRCSAAIRRMKIGSRSAHICPKCQRFG